MSMRVCQSQVQQFIYKREVCDVETNLILSRGDKTPKKCCDVEVSADKHANRPSLAVGTFSCSVPRCLLSCWREVDSNVICTLADTDTVFTKFAST